MGIEIPESLQWVAKYVVGAGDWPEGDETAMRRVESAWTKLATDLRDLDADANYAIDQVLASIEGDTAQAIADRWTRLGHGQGAFDGLIAHIETLADEIGDGAADIEQTKLVILASLAIFAVEMAVALAAASTGIGAPAAAAEAAAAQVATRIAIRTAIKQLVQRLLSKAALKAAARAAVRGAWEAALEETALDLGTKALQVATGRRDEITTEDLTEAGKNALTAAASGAVTGALGADGLTGRNVPGGPEGGNPLANAAKDAAKETVAGVAGEVAGEATDAALNDREFSWENALAPENLSSAAAGGLQRGTETLGESNSGDGPNTTGENSENGGDEDPTNETQDAGDQQNDDNQPSGGEPDPGDPDTPTTPQNPSQQATQPAGTNPQLTPDTSTQAQPSSSGQQPPGQPTDTGSQAAAQESPSPHGQNGPSPEPPTGSQEDSPSAGTREPESQQSPGSETPSSPQSTPSGSGTPDSQEPPTGTPDTQQGQLTDTSAPDSPSQGLGSETPLEAGGSAADPPRSPDAPEASGAVDENGSDPNQSPGADPEPPQPASSLNLGPDTTTSPDAGTPSAVTPGAVTTPETSIGSDTSNGQDGSQSQSMPSATSPGASSTASSPTTQSTAPDGAGLSRTDQGPTAAPGETTTPGDTTTGETPSAPGPPPDEPVTSNPAPSTTAPETSTAEATLTTTSAATAAPPSPPAPVTSATPSSAPGDSPRPSNLEPATSSPIGANPAGLPRNQDRPQASPATRPTRAPDPADGTNRETTPGMPETTPNTVGYSHNLFDPANHTRFLADFARPPIPARPLPADTTNPDSSRQQNVAEPPVTDFARTDRTDPGTRSETPGDSTSDPGGTGRLHWNTPRAGDPIWNAPDRPRPPHQQPGPPDIPRPPQRTSPSHTPLPPRQQHPNSHIPQQPGQHSLRQSLHHPNTPPGNSNRTGESLLRRPQSPMEQIRAIRERYRIQRPLGDRATGVPARGIRDTNGRPSYSSTQHRLPNGDILHVATIRVHLSTHPHTTPDEVGRLVRSAEDAADRAFNTGPQLLSGDRLMVDVVFTSDPNDAHLSINNNSGEIRDRNFWSPYDSTAQRVDNLRMHLGLMPNLDSGPLTPEDLRQISNDIALANTEPRFENPSDTRIEGPQRLDEVEDEAHQTRVEDSLRQGNRFVVGADPRTHPYGQLINDGGRTVDGRSNNCLDCALSALSSFYGNPQVSAPRWPDTLPDGSPDTRGGERGGPERASQWLGENWVAFNNMPIPGQFQALHDLISRQGPGSAALVGNYWHARDAHGNLEYDHNGNPVVAGGHATVVLYPPGSSGPVWWDPQAGETSDAPPHTLVQGSCYLQFIPIDPPGGLTHAGTPGNTAASPTISGDGSAVGAGIQSSGEPIRMGVPGDPDAGGDPERPGDGPRLLRAEQTNRGDHGPFESTGGDDSRGVRPGDPDRSASSRPADLSPDLERGRPIDGGDPRGDRLSRPSDITHEPSGGPTDRPSTDDPQSDSSLPDGRADETPRLPPDRSVGDRRVHPDRDMAGGQDLSVLDSADRAGDHENSSEVDSASARSSPPVPNPDRQTSLGAADVLHEGTRPERADPVDSAPSRPESDIAGDGRGSVQDRFLHHADHDPLRRHGPAAETHPEEVRRFIAEAESVGVEIQYRPGAMAYGPAPTTGRPGTLVIDPEASYGAWLHEMRHMRDDRDGGWLGMRALIDQETRDLMERRAYMEEIEYARSIGDRTSEVQLYQNLRRERRMIWRRQR